MEGGEKPREIAVVPPWSAVSVNGIVEARAIRGEAAIFAVKCP